MSEVTDLIMPILQKIQSDIGSLRTEFRVLADKTDSRDETLDALKNCITYTVGLHAPNRADTDIVQDWKKEIERRLTVLEAARL